MSEERAGEVYSLAALLARRTERDRPWLEFLRRASLSVGVYQLDAAERDRQRPHTEDEIYYVIEGEGVIEIAGERRPVHPGDVIFVARGVEHRFSDYPHGITLLVVFAPAQGSGSGQAPE